MKNNQQSLILAIEESVSLKKKIILLEKDINSAINLIYKTLKNKKKRELTLIY